MQERKAIAALPAIILSIYLSGVYSVAGLPSLFYVRYSPNLNLSPFLYLFSDHTGSLLNVLLFVPLGLLLPILWHQFLNPIKIIACGFFLSCTIEFMQLYTYRTTDINDLITNTSGTIFGYLISILSVKLFSQLALFSSKQTIQEILAVVFFTMFFINPILQQIFSIII